MEKLIIFGRLVECRWIDELAQEAADLFVEIAKTSIKDHGSFSIALSGGNTPAVLFKKLAEDEYKDLLNWANIHVFWGDERCVAPDDEDSNYRLAGLLLLSKVDIPNENIHRIVAEKGENGAIIYEEEIRSHFNLKAGSDIFPEFDLILLGMGDDAHIASLFPGSSAINEDKRLVTAIPPVDGRIMRVSLTPPVLKAAKNIAVLISGMKKRNVLRQVMSENYDPAKLPAQLLKKVNGNLAWFTDFYIM